MGEKTSEKGAEAYARSSLEDLSLVRDLVCRAAGKRRQPEILKLRRNATGICLPIYYPKG